MLKRSAKSPFMPSTLVFPGGRLDPEDGHRDQLSSWETAAKRECREEADVDLGDRALTWFDTWLTPSMESRRRYLARFFVTVLRADEGDDAQADGHETHAGRWATVDDHLTAWRDGEIDLPPPTICILLTLQTWTAQAKPEQSVVDAIAAAAQAVDAQDTILPKVALLEQRPTIIMPHAPDYDTTPGEALAAPARAAALPKYFARDDRGWRPR